jgi:hypothetical protein
MPATPKPPKRQAAPAGTELAETSG